MSLSRLYIYYHQLSLQQLCEAGDTIPFLKLREIEWIAQASASSWQQSQDWSWVCVNSMLSSRLFFQHILLTPQRQHVFQFQGWGHQTNRYTPVTALLKDPFQSHFFWEAFFAPLPHKPLLLFVGWQSSTDYFQ